MRDPDIRAALRGWIAEGHPDPVENRICEEMAVGLGASRVDVGLINGQITGHEIKSARDNLDRLPSQIEHYTRCLDAAWIVTTERRAVTIEDHVPTWWGVLVACGTEQTIEISVQRPADHNPDIEPFYVAQLLWRDEAYAELESRDLHHGLRKATRWDLWDRLALLPMDDLSAAVRRRLKARP